MLKQFFLPENQQKNSTENSSTSIPKEKMLALIISQLNAFGYSEISKLICDKANLDRAVLLESSVELSTLCSLGSSLQKKSKADNFHEFDQDIYEGVEDLAGDSENCFVYPNPNQGKNEPPSFSTLYITTHKDSCTTAKFSEDGKYFATGSADNSLKVLDVSKILRAAKNHTSTQEDKPVIRTFYDHLAQINDLSFHPNGLVLASCSSDMNIKLFDISKPTVKRAFRYFQDGSEIRSICFHPSGDYIAAGTLHESIRLFDVKTFQCYTPGRKNIDEHTNAINMVRYSKNGGMICSASRDGTIKVWDGSSGRCIKSIESAHSGLSVVSAVFSKNEKYILSNGSDGIIKLWDVTSGNLIMSYTHENYKINVCQANFTYDEKFIVCGGVYENSVLCFDSYTAETVSVYKGHANRVRCMATSPTENAFVTCSLDHRARFWASSECVENST